MRICHARVQYPCRELWDNVVSDVNQNDIIFIPPSNTTLNTTWPGPLLPELAQLKWLRILKLLRRTARDWAGIPVEWVQPGAFSRLEQ